MKRYLPSIVLMTVGWITLLTYFLPGLVFVRLLLVEVAIIVVAFGMLLGAGNVLSVHLTQVSRGPSRFFSFILVASFLIVFMVSFVFEGGADLASKFVAGRMVQDAPHITQQGIAGPVMVGVYQHVLIPTQSALAALLPFLLAFAAYRTLRIRTAASRAGAIIFLSAAILGLLGQVWLLNQSFLGVIREWIVSVLAMAGMRGILLGVAIGITATALRVLIGADRPTSD